MNRAAFQTQFGPCAVVTGASDGIGREFARQLAKRGMKLVLVARRHAELQALCRELAAAHGVECVAHAIDLASPSAGTTIAQLTEALDVGLLVAAAGFGTSGNFIEQSLETERSMLALNCDAVLTMSWHFARRFATQSRGGLVLFSSIVAFQGVGHSANYAATKAWVQTFAEGLQVELNGQGVDVVAVAPGPVASGFGERAQMDLGNAMPASKVAAETLDALGERGFVRPGGLSKLLGWSLATMPRWGRVRVMSRIMGSMTSHHRERPAGESAT
jgi:short-subunit dehydrogenase